MAHRWASLRGRRLVAAGSQADRLPGVARRRVHGGHRPDQDWSAWTWEAREFGTGTREPRTIRFTCVQRALPEVVDSVRQLAADPLVLDGELQVVDEAGEVDFDAACARLRSAAGPPVQVFMFDLPSLDGAELRGRPLRERKALLARVLGAGDSVLKPVHFIVGAPEPLVESAKELGFEGVIAKYSGAPYQGGRTSLWREGRGAASVAGVPPLHQKVGVPTGMTNDQRARSAVECPPCG